MQAQHESSRRPGSVTSTSDDGDNITLQAPQALKTETHPDDMSMDVLATNVEVDQRLTTSRITRPSGGTENAVMSGLSQPELDADQEMMDILDDEDQVEEYHFSSDEETYVDDGEVIENDDAKSVITVSSSPDTPEDLPFGMSERPWKIAGFSNTLRRNWEMMYSTVQQTPLGGDWEATEAYQKAKDREMLLYIQDFPLAKWVIPKEQAETAYTQLIDRIRWRSLGIAIYSQTHRAYITGPPGMAPGLLANGMPPPQSNGVYRQHGLRREDSHPSVFHSSHRPPPQQQIQGAPPHMYQGVPKHLVPLQPNQILPSQRPPMPSQQLQNKMSGPSSLQSAKSGEPNHTGRFAIGGQGDPVNPSALGHQSTVPPRMTQAHDMNAQAQHSSYDLQSLPMQNQPSGPKKRKKEKEPSSPGTPPPPPPTPPYEPRQRPADRKIPFTKGKGRQIRKQAEAEEYPWHRKLEFKEIREKAYWDDSMYDRQVLDDMASTRRKNEPYIMKLDEEQSEKQRINRQKKHGMYQKLEGGESSEGDKSENKGVHTRKSAAGGDPYHSGNYSFATAEDAQKAAQIQANNPDELIAAAEGGSIDWSVCRGIMICWNPGKKGTAENLIQASFRVYDTLVTRRQLHAAKVLTRRAAECIIDFCPDMLWRETLLRIVAEGGMGNKDVRDRFCFNGCYADKATITKRIAAALGQKQTHGKAKDRPPVSESANKKRRGPNAQPLGERWQPGEEDYYACNGEDFDNYIRFFGKRQSARSQLKLSALPAGTKRKDYERDDEDEDGELKRAKTQETNGTEGESSGIDFGLDTADDEDARDEDEEGDEVSAQDSDILDAIDD